MSADWSFTIEDRCLIFYSGMCSRPDCSNCTKQEGQA